MRIPDVGWKDEYGPVAVGDLELEEDESVGGGVGVGRRALRPLHALVEEGVVRVRLAHERALLDELREHLHQEISSGLILSISFTWVDSEGRRLHLLYIIVITVFK